MKSPSKSARTAKAPGKPRKMRTKASSPRPVQHSSGAPVEGHARANAHNASAGRVTVRVYRQGLGDCILVRVKRAEHDDFKLMIDCGVVLGTPDAGKIMTGVMDNLVGDTQEKVDVLAITHEHWDHLSGFTQAPNSFAKLAVGSVWVAWTEDAKDDLANELRTELGAAKKKLVACANALHAVGDAATVEMIEGIALTPLGTAASSSTGTKAAFDTVKARGNVRICRPSDAPFEIPGANARIYVLGPPHDPKLIRKINPSTAYPETYGLGIGALPLGVVVALDSRDDASRHDVAAPFHPRDRFRSTGKAGSRFSTRRSTMEMIGRGSINSSRRTMSRAPSGGASTANGSAPRPNWPSRCKATRIIRASCWRSRSASPVRATCSCSLPTRRWAIGSLGKRGRATRTV